MFNEGKEPRDHEVILWVVKDCVNALNILAHGYNTIVKYKYTYQEEKWYRLSRMGHTSTCLCKGHSE